MVLVAAVPLSIADTHEVVKGEQGPRAGAITWEFVPPALGNWSGHIENSGLRSLVVDVYDNTTGAMDQVMHERIRFASLGAYPTGEVNTSEVVMSPSHKYTIIVTPNGPKEASCTVEDVFVLPSGNMPPVAAFNFVYDTTEFRGEVRTIAYTESYDPDGTIVSYYWTFGDGGGSSGDRAVHTYAAPGTYTITLRVTDNDGLTDWAQKTVIISDMPAATFTHYGGSGLEVAVDASGSYTNPGGTILSYDWDFGDGGTGSGVVASHKYPYVGEPMSYYTIGLTVTDSDGLKAMACKIVGAVDYYPDSSFTHFVDVFTVRVDASNSWDDTGIVSYAWSWGDGTFGTNITANHTYALPGTYTIRLVVTDEVGQTSEATHDVLVPPLPIPSFTYTVSGSTIYVDASGSSGYGGIVSYTWDWGDGSASETYAAPTATHTYSTARSMTADSGYALSGKGRNIPHPIFGYTYAADGVTALPGCIVFVTNVRTGETISTTSDPIEGVYSVDANQFALGWRFGDVIDVTALKDSMFGENEGIIVDTPEGYLWLDIILTGPGHMIMLTVTDTLGQTSTMTQFVVGA